jgi:hydroxymethylpyrimidine/phosphomethylpyrimidine kinase
MTMGDPAPPVVLTIGGSDPTAGAGVQGDIRTIARLGGYGVCAVTAVTAQDTAVVRATRTVDAALLAEQLVALAGDLRLAAVKIGMLGSRANVAVVADFLAARPGLPVVLDPVLAATGGTSLLDEPGRAALIDRLLPLATLVTPNLPELALLSGRPVATQDEVHAAARDLLALGARAVLVTGGHAIGPEVVDWLHGGNVPRPFRGPRLAVAVHGTGCALTAAIAVGLAGGRDLVHAIEEARTDLGQRLAAALALGRGQRLLP